MIYDAENTFLFNESLTNTPKIISNGVGGDAYNALFLTAKFTSGVSAAATVTLKTGDKADLSDAATLCTLTIPKGALRGSIRVPSGGKSYYGITVAGPTSETCTVALTLDTDME